MKTIYIDAEYKCHAESGTDRRAVRTDLFDDKCAAFIEGYRYIPAGETWIRSDGAVFAGPMMTPWRDYGLLMELQAVSQGTLIQEDIPAFDPYQDYSGWSKGSQVLDDGQIWALLKPHNAARYSLRPSQNRAFWCPVHTKDPRKARPYVAPYGVSGVWMAGECYRAEDGSVKRCIMDNVGNNADEYPEAWEDVTYV